MDNPFKQPKATYKIIFDTNFKHIELFENFFPDNIGISTYEVESETVESMPEDIWRFEVYVTQKPQISKLSQDLSEFAKRQKLNIISKIKFEKIEDKDWVAQYQRQQKPIETDRFFIGSNQHQNSCPQDKVGIYLESSRAFGTGDHETTAGCIKAMEHLSNYNFKHIFDIGTGSGILSFIAEKIWPEAKIIACDIEKEVIKIAKTNKNCNNSNVYFYQNTPKKLLPEKTHSKTFDLIISNILAAPLIELSSSIASLCHSNSKVILSGFLDYQMQDVINAYEKSGFVTTEIIDSNKWIIAIFTAK